MLSNVKLLYNIYEEETSRYLKGSFQQWQNNSITEIYSIAPLLCKILLNIFFINKWFSFEHQSNKAVKLYHCPNTNFVTMALSESNPSIVYSQTEKNHWAQYFAHFLFFFFTLSPSLEVLPRSAGSQVWRHSLKIFRCAGMCDECGPCWYRLELIRLERCCEMSLAFTNILTYWFPVFKDIKRWIRSNCVFIATFIYIFLNW